VVFFRPGIDVDDVTDSFNAHDLSHRLPAGVYRDQILPRFHKIAGSCAPESSTTAAFTARSRSPTDGSFGWAQVDLTSGAASTLPSPPAATTCSYRRRIIRPDGASCDRYVSTAHGAY
jgi:hypothetical protein